VIEHKEIRVLCVDDNALLGDAIRHRLSMEEGLVWHGLLPDADHLLDQVLQAPPDIVLLDVDMPGKDPFEVMKELSARCPKTRVIMYTGHVHADLIERALEAGAWGYVSKNEDVSAILKAIREVAAGEVSLGPDVQAVFNGF